MTFGTGALRGTPGVVDHRLSRRHLINEFKRGRLRQDQVCDAHPELIRAARNLGSPASIACPICGDEELRLVTYVFGPRLPPGGRCITSAKEMHKLARRSGTFTTYVVEVCTDCHWNHLARVFPLAERTARR